eukprot:5268157-Alexandrium_andersonii.AAC.1
MSWSPSHVLVVAASCLALLLMGVDSHCSSKSRFHGKSGFAACRPAGAIPAAKWVVGLRKRLASDDEEPL